MLSCDLLQRVIRQLGPSAVSKPVACSVFTRHVFRFSRFVRGCYVKTVNTSRRGSPRRIQRYQKVILAQNVTYNLLQLNRRRIATVNTYSKPPLYYTLGAVAPLLPCLRTAAVARHTHSGLAALCRYSADILTRDRHDLPTSQPDSSRFASTEL